MAPRKPPTSRIRRKADAANTLAAASPVAKPAARKAGGISPYPDLKMAILMLEQRALHVGDERRALIEKWVAQLAKIQHDITRLRKLEQLASSLSQPQQESLPL